MRRFIPLLAVVISFILSLSTVSFAADYLATGSGTISLPDNYAINGIYDEISAETVSNSFTAGSKSYSAAATSSQSHIFGDALGSINRVFYDALSKISSVDTEIAVDFGRELTEYEFNQLNVQYIADAFFLDFPEIFWFNSFSIHYEFNGFFPSRHYFNFTIVPDIDYEKYPDIAVLRATLTTLIKNADFEYTTRYEFLKCVHDYLCNKIEYVTNAPRCYDAVGALIDNRAVCQGYAESFKMFCDYYKIPCILVIGRSKFENHMWNAVRMDDGKWYFIDTTWDDGPDIFYDYFLNGTETVDENFGGKEFSESHTIKYSHGNYGNLTISYPEFSGSAYNLTDENKYSLFSASTGFKADYDKHILYSSVSSSLSGLYYNGLSFSLSDFYTSSCFNISDSEATSEKWMLMLYGDMNGDGVFDDEDCEIVKTKSLLNEPVTDIDDVIADVNNDGVIDNSDLSVYVNEKFSQSCFSYLF